MQDYYAELNVSNRATQEEIRKAYLRLAFKWHPDKNLSNLKKAEVKFKKIHKAFTVLNDVEARKRYDKDERTDKPYTPRKTKSQTGLRYENRRPEDVFKMYFGDDDLFTDIFGTEPFCYNPGKCGAGSEKLRSMNPLELALKFGPHFEGFDKFRAKLPKNFKFDRYTTTVTAINTRMKNNRPVGFMSSTETETEFDYGNKIEKQTIIYRGMKTVTVKINGVLQETYS